MKNTKLITMVEGALIAVAALLLSFIPVQTPNAAFDLSLGLIPLAIFAMRRGALAGLASGFVWGLLCIVLGKAFILSIPQVLFEYPIAFAFGGLGGVFSGRLKRYYKADNNRGILVTLVFAALTSVIARWFCLFIAGATVWASYAPESMNPIFYSFLLNGASAIANAALLIIVFSAVSRAKILEQCLTDVYVARKFD